MVKDKVNPARSFATPAAGLFGRLNEARGTKPAAFITLPDVDEFEQDYIRYLDRLETGDERSAKPFEKGAHG